MNTLVYSLYTGLYLFASLPLRGSPSLGLLGTPQVGYLVIIPIYQHEHDNKRAGLPGQLIAGHMDQAKSQWAAGEVAAVISFQLTLYSEENRAAPRFSAQISYFLSTSAGQERQSLPEPR